MTIQTIGKRAKHLTIVAIAAAAIGGLAFVPSANAQSSGDDSRSGQATPSSQMVERRVAMLTSHLQLYSGQVARIRSILTREREQTTAARNNVSDTSRPDRAGPGPRARNAPPPDVREIRDRTERDIEKVLSTRQVAAYRALKEGKRLPSYLPQNHRRGITA